MASGRTPNIVMTLIFLDIEAKPLFYKFMFKKSGFQYQEYGMKVEME